MTRTMLPDFKMDQAAIGYCPRFDAMGRDDEKFAFEACGFRTTVVSTCADLVAVDASRKRQITSPNANTGCIRIQSVHGTAIASAEKRVVTGSASGDERCFRCLLHFSN